jgi:membrane-associated protease RseP (regulator of RpoE activity)
VKITEVMEHSAAKDAGLTVGDEIMTINGQPVNQPRDVITAIGQHAEGDQVEVTIRRDGEDQKIVAKLRDFPVSTAERRFVEAKQHGERGKLYGIDADGKIRVWKLADGAIVPFVHDSQRSLTPDHLNNWLKLYADNATKPVAPTTVRVQRSDVEKKLDELTRRVSSLQGEVEKLTGELKAINENLKQE